jgi:hypothetical protein
MRLNCAVVRMRACIVAMREQNLMMTGCLVVLLITCIAVTSSEAAVHEIDWTRTGVEQYGLKLVHFCWI